MAAYMITTRGSHLWDLPVFHAGQDDCDEAVMVFTSRRLAETFLQSADWNEDHCVSELTAIDLFEILFEAHQGGVRYVAVNPDYKRYLAGANQPVLVLAIQVANFAELLTRSVLATGQRAPASP